MGKARYVYVVCGHSICWVSRPGRSVVRLYTGGTALKRRRSMEIAQAIQGILTGGILAVVILVILLAVATWLPSSL